jgi:purine-binding chemotaxis protein CheW
MSQSHQYVAFCLEEQLFALRLSAVERIVRAAEVTPLPSAPEAVLGVINMLGQVIPVFDTRRRFGLPVREVTLSDQFIVALSRARRVALVVDTVRGVHESAEEDTVALERVLPVRGHIEGVVKLKDGLVCIHDLDEFLSPDEDKTLDAALKL